MVNAMRLPVTKEACAALGVFIRCVSNCDYATIGSFIPAPTRTFFFNVTLSLPVKLGPNIRRPVRLTQFRNGCSQSLPFLVSPGYPFDWITYFGDTRQSSTLRESRRYSTFTRHKKAITRNAPFVSVFCESNATIKSVPPTCSDWVLLVAVNSVAMPDGFFQVEAEKRSALRLDQGLHLLHDALDESDGQVTDQIRAPRTPVHAAGLVG